MIMLLFSNEEVFVLIWTFFIPHQIVEFERKYKEKADKKKADKKETGGDKRKSGNRMFVLLLSSDITGLF